MYTDLVYDAHIGAWTYLDIFNNDALNKKHPKRFHLRSGFYPYEYNFIFRCRSGQTQCSYCGNFFNTKTITRDHVYPKSRGGVLTTPACYRCNTLKADMLPIDWAVFNSLRAIDV